MKDNFIFFILYINQARQGSFTLYLLDAGTHAKVMCITANRRHLYTLVIHTQQKGRKHVYLLMTMYSKPRARTVRREGSRYVHGTHPSKAQAEPPRRGLMHLFHLEHTTVQSIICRMCVVGKLESTWTSPYQIGYGYYNGNKTKEGGEKVSGEEEGDFYSFSQKKKNEEKPAWWLFISSSSEEDLK